MGSTRRQGLRRFLRREYVWSAVVLAIVVAAMFPVRRFAPALQEALDEHTGPGILLYLGLNIVDALFAPGATLPLIPVAVRVWGRLPAALLTIAGWTAGSLLAFLIARRWGGPIVEKLVPLERVKQMRGYLPENLFWSVVLFRAVLPMDVISYVIGLFTDMPTREYLFATLLGLVPSALLLTALGKMPNGYDVIMLGVGGLAAAGYFLVVRRRRHRAV
jgi:uncharacterized membrane protein YdjX (TVP38/TMEM64 family)